MSENAIEIDDLDLANVTATYRDLESKGPELKIAKGAITLHFLRKSIRYKENNSYKKCNGDEPICTEPIKEHSDFENYYSPLRPGFLYLRIFHINKDHSKDDYLEFQISKLGTLCLLSKSTGKVWNEDERGALNTQISFLSIDQGCMVDAAYSEIKWSNEYVEEQYNARSASCFKYFDADQWYHDGINENAIKGDQYLNSYYIYTPSLFAFNQAHNSYISNKDDWEYEEDAFFVLEDTLGQISDLCYETLHSNLSITANMMAPLLDTTDEELLNSIENGKLNELIEQAGEVDINEISVDQTGLKAREKARKAINGAKKIIVGLLRNENRNVSINKELMHYLKNNVMQGKFRVLEISRFLATPNDLVDFMIKDEKAESDEGLQFITDVVLGSYSNDIYYALLHERIDVNMDELSEVHYAYWSSVIDIFGDIALYHSHYIDILERQFQPMIESVWWNNNGLSLMSKIFKKYTKYYDVEEYILEMPEAELKAIEKKHNATIARQRRFVFPKSEMIRNDVESESFSVLHYYLDYKGFNTIDEWNGLKDETIKLYDLLNKVNQKVVSWLSDDAMSDLSKGRKVRFTNLDDYTQHILKRTFGIKGDNPNGIVFPDPKSNSLLYTGIAYNNSELYRAKVYAMSFETLRDKKFYIPGNKATGQVVKYIRLSKGGALHEVNYSNPVKLSIEPFNYDGSLNTPFVTKQIKGWEQISNSHYKTIEEETQLIIHGIHQAQKDFINHPVTQAAIFVLTGVIAAGISTSYSLGSRALVYGRNAYAKASQMTVKQMAQTAGKVYLKKKGSQYAIDATRSVCYQSIVEQKINLVTVTMDTFIHPYVGEFVGNAFFVGVNFSGDTFEFKSDSIFSNGVTSKEFISFVMKSSIKAILNGGLSIDNKIYKRCGVLGVVPYDAGLQLGISNLDKYINEE